MIKNRLNRSELAVPASKVDFFEKAANSNSDIIFLDLEDSVPLDEKKKARNNAIDAVNNIDWKKKSLSIRINSQESKLADLDIDHILKNTSDRLDLIMLPKVNNANDVLKIDKTISTLELKYKRKKKIGLELIIETALGMQNVNEIASYNRRLESLHFGVADYAASTKRMAVCSVPP